MRRKALLRNGGIPPRDGCAMVTTLNVERIAVPKPGLMQLQKVERDLRARFRCEKF
jgi:hypothetical protein